MRAEIIQEITKKFYKRSKYCLGLFDLGNEEAEIKFCLRFKSIFDEVMLIYFLKYGQSSIKIPN